MNEYLSASEGMFHVSIGGLHILADREELINEIPSTSLDGLLCGYHGAYQQFKEQILGEEKPLALPSFPQAQVVLTQNRAVFKDFFPNPSQFDTLPSWVSGYVNFSRSAYVRMIHDPSTFTEDSNGAAHEFTHAIMPHLLHVPSAYLDANWPTWVNESFSVGLHQRQPTSWLIQEIKARGFALPNISQIQDKGIFSIDNRMPMDNIAYQYCVLFTEAYSSYISEILYADEPVKPRKMYGICDLTQRAFRENQSLAEATRQLGLDIDQIEEELHQQLLQELE